MNARVTSVAEALELYMPPFEHVDDRWDEIAVAIPAPRSVRRPLLAAAAVAIATTLVATPALGIRGLIADLIGRIDVSFSSGESAPLEIKRDFYNLGIGAPAGLDQQAIASEARRVAAFTVRGRRHVIWVAPTRGGGYCWQVSRAFGGCRAKTSPPLGVSWSVGAQGNTQYVVSVGGDITSARAHTLVLEYADRTHSAIPFYYVSKPIDAGFFFTGVPGGHDTAATRPTALVLRDAAGRVLGRQRFPYETPAQLARDRARTKAMLKQLRLHRPGVTPHPSPKLPPPTAPFQTGGADGVKVVAGHNGVVVFDTVDASPAVRKLIQGNAVGYGCFKNLPYNLGPVELTFPRTLADRVAIRLGGRMSPPFLGCEIEGTYGHRWPDRNGSHSAVEIAFTPAARTYFTDRAAARDLVLFVRSRTMHRLRRLTGSSLTDALRRTYGTNILATGSPPAGRIGYTTSGDTTTFVETSRTGKRFYVRFTNGRLSGQNAKPYAYPF